MGSCSPTPRRLSLLLIVWLFVPAAGQGAPCAAWPGEPDPLPTVSDSDPFLARWSELRARELRELAETTPESRAGTIAALRAHAACLSPRTLSGARALPVRIRRMGLASLPELPGEVREQALDLPGEVREQAIVPTRQPRPRPEPPQGQVVGDSLAASDLPTGTAGTAGTAGEDGEIGTPRPVQDRPAATSRRVEDPVAAASVRAEADTVEPWPVVESSTAPQAKQPTVAPSLQPEEVAVARRSVESAQPTVRVASRDADAVIRDSDARVVPTLREPDAGVVPTLREPEPSVGAEGRRPSPQVLEPSGIDVVSGAAPSLASSVGVAEAEAASDRRSPVPANVEPPRRPGARSTPPPTAPVRRPETSTPPRRVAPPAPSTDPIPAEPVRVAARRPTPSPARGPEPRPLPDVSAAPPPSAAPELALVRELAVAPPSEALLKEPRGHVRDARFEAALAAIDGVRPKLTGPDAAPLRAELEVLAATASLALGRSDDARKRFAAALSADPALELDPAIYSPKLRDLLSRVRAETGSTP